MKFSSSLLTFFLLVAPANSQDVPKPHTSASLPALETFITDLRESTKNADTLWFSVAWGRCPMERDCGDQRLSVLMSGRIWRIKNEQLVEVVPTLLRFPQELTLDETPIRELEYQASVVSLQSLSSTLFFGPSPSHPLLRAQGTHRLVAVRALGSHRWALEYLAHYPKAQRPDETYTVVFAPRPAKIAPPIVRLNSGVDYKIPTLSTPYNLREKIQGQAAKLTDLRQVPHWSQSQTARTWYYESHIPNSLLQEFKAALKTWQKALPTVSWRADGIAVDSLDPAQCMVQGALCFGAKADGLLACDKGPCTTNCTGTTSADPRNGEILGGLVFCEASTIPARATPIESGARTDKTQPQLTWEQAKQSSEEGVQLFGKEITAQKIKLTFNAASHLIALSRRWLFLHELGHIYGLGHNFLASTAIKNSGAVRSVMDYLPFYAFIDERNAELGDWDVAAIRNLYWGTSLPEDYRACHHDEEGSGLCIAEDYGSATTNTP